MRLSATCRVCLASDREMYRLANTPLEKTYERVTSKTLVVEGRPCCVCGVCLSALRRCRRFIDTAQKANNELDRWVRQQHNKTKLKLTERPLFSFTRSITESFEITFQQSGIQETVVKPERDTSENESTMIDQQNKDNEGNIPMNELKYEIISDDDNDNTQMSDNIESHNSQMFKSGCINVYDDMIDIENDTATTDVKFEIMEILDNVGDETTPVTSNDERNQDSSDEDVPLNRLGSRKRGKLSGETESGPLIKKRRSITSEHWRRNNDPAATQHDEENTLSCHQCDYSTTNKFSLKTHLAIHSDVKPFACDKCDYRFRQKSHLNRHLMTHTDEKPFACDICDFECKQKVDLIRHIIRHTGEKPFACNKCDYKCSVPSRLKLHTMIHTGEKLLGCDKCDYKCKKNVDLKLHLLRHTGKKPFECDKCDYKCLQKEDFKRHLIRHTGEKPFSCDFCDYKCIRQSSLKQHLFRHAGEKPLACDKCDYKCIRMSHLKSHSKVHSKIEDLLTGEKPFACDKCDYKCTKKSILKKHLLTHTGEKTFACDKCDYKCSRKYRLKNHLFTHTGEKPFGCDKCDYKCCKKYRLINHISKAHADSKHHASDKTR